jgi:hypothetical protein
VDECNATLLRDCKWKHKLRHMPKRVIAIAVLSVTIFVSGWSAFADDTDFRMALPGHKGQLQWRAAGYKIVQTSAKPKGQEIGFRGANDAKKTTFLGFLFLTSGEGALTAEKCGDRDIEERKREDATVAILSNVKLQGSKNGPVSVVTFSRRREGKFSYGIVGFAAKGDMCGSLEFYSPTSLTLDDPEIKSTFESFALDSDYAPLFTDILLYADILYRHAMYKDAAPVFEQALSKLEDDKSADVTMRRVTTDQAGMSYGISGDTAKARSIFESAIAKDPDYAMYYYMLACADAQDKKLEDAQLHLKQAFERKANVIKGESLPDPSKDDSFLPYKRNKDFWQFIESLH